MSRFQITSASIATLFLSQAIHAALVVNPAKPITHRVQVQPIIVMQAAADGGAAATYFGTSAQSAIILGHVNTIWAQAGVEVEFLTANSYESSFAYDGSPDDYSATSRPTMDLSTIVSAAGSPPKGASTSILNMFFVNIVPGFSFTSEFTANGLAFLDANGVAQFVGSGLLDFEAGREVIAAVVSHEIGHNLGLGHETTSGTEDNLLHSPGSSRTGERITETQISTIFTNGGGLDGFELLQPIPEPSIASLGILATIAFASRRKRSAA